MANENNDPKNISRSEKTSAKNLENLHLVIGTIDLIENYQPTNALILPAALAEFATGFAARMQATNAVVVAEDAAVGAQTAAFRLVRRKITKIISAVKGQGVSAQSLRRLMTTVRRLRGVRAPHKERLNADGSAPVKHSVSHQSFAGMLESLDTLNEQINLMDGYQPNEAEYKKEAIALWIGGLREIRYARMEAQIAVLTARQERNTYNYGEEGIIVRMNILKAYLDTILDKSDTRYKTIKALKFVDSRG